MGNSPLHKIKIRSTGNETTKCRMNLRLRPLFLLKRGHQWLLKGSYSWPRKISKTSCCRHPDRRLAHRELCMTKSWSRWHRSLEQADWESKTSQRSMTFSRTIEIRASQDQGPKETIIERRIAPHEHKAQRGKPFKIHYPTLYILDNCLIKKQTSRSSLQRTCCNTEATKTCSTSRQRRLRTRIDPRIQFRIQCV